MTLGQRDGRSADGYQKNESLDKGELERSREQSTPIPYYLQQYYWWAYVHPNAVKVFERDWLINAILWGNYTRLRNAAIDALGAEIPGRTLQVASAYGDFSIALAERVAASGGALDIIDVLPVQIDNVRAKLGPDLPVSTAIMDSASLGFDDGICSIAFRCSFCCTSSLWNGGAGRSRKRCAWFDPAATLSSSSMRVRNGGTRCDISFARFSARLNPSRLIFGILRSRNSCRPRQPFG